MVYCSPLLNDVWRRTRISSTEFLSRYKTILLGFICWLGYIWGTQRLPTYISTFGWSAVSNSSEVLLNLLTVISDGSEPSILWIPTACVNHKATQHCPFKRLSFYTTSQILRQCWTIFLLTVAVHTSSRWTWIPTGFEQGLSKHVSCLLCHVVYFQCWGCVLILLRCRRLLLTQPAGGGLASFHVLYLWPTMKGAGRTAKLTVSTRYSTAPYIIPF